MTDYNRAFQRGSNDPFQRGQSNTFQSPSNSPFQTGPTNTRTRYDLNVSNEKEDRKRIPAICVVDSQRRDLDIYPDPSNYVINLPKTYTDVRSIELIQANIPSSGYSVYSNNNTVTFQFDNDNLGDPETFTTSLTEGNYTATSLATELEARLNAITLRTGADAGELFIVVADSTRGVLHVTAPLNTTAGDPHADRTLRFIAGGTNNADRTIGLSSTIVGDGELYMPDAYDLQTAHYIAMSIKNMERCEGNSNTLIGAFCVIALDSTGSNFVVNGDVINNDRYVYYFPEIQSKLTRLEISFRRPDGTLYDFNNRDHTLVFRIDSLNRPYVP